MGSFLDELKRCEALGLTRLNLHPGSHLKLLSVEAACDRVAMSINTALEQTSGVTVVIENTAGQGAYLGATFEELRRIYDGVNDKSRIGFCLDTAHSLAAGFDVATPDGMDAFLEAFDRIVGLMLLRGMHLNDSKGTLGSHLDRHACFGEGNIGWEALLHLVRHPALQNIPLILETPEPERWPEETRRLIEA
jgi:deoxyribonuclease-4